MAKALDESDVGISCFVSPLPGFRGVLKQRYADFIVNEVDSDGNVVRLVSFDIPYECSEDPEEEAGPTDASYTKEVEMFRSLVGETDAELLKGFLASIVSGDVRDNASIVLSPDADKAHRTEVHNFFKKNMRIFTTDVVDASPENSKCIRVRYSCGEKGDMGKGSRKRKAGDDNFSKADKPFDSRGSNNWPANRGKFLRFHLYKENKETQEALGTIGKMLGVQQRSFGFAGTKDKRAITTQRVTVFKQHAKKLAALNSRLVGLKVGDFCYVKEGLVLGQLSGNRFTVVLRGVIADCEDTIKLAADALGCKGFINYYGLQRFGSGSIPTHLVGAALLRGEWKVAVGLILDPRDGERRPIREAREYYKETGDIEETLKQLPHHLVAERAILSCLKKCPGNYLQALKAIPRTLRMMYVHSYQSYLWNHVASMRVQKYGVGQVVLGDLVYCKSHSTGDLVKDNFVEPQDINGEPQDINGIVVQNNDDESDRPEPAPSDGNDSLVKVIKEDDLTEGIYTVEDVILPLPGSRVIYPENEVTDVYHELSNKDSIKLSESIHGANQILPSCGRRLNLQASLKASGWGPTENVRLIHSLLTSITGLKINKAKCELIDLNLTENHRDQGILDNLHDRELLSYTDDNKPLMETDLDAISKKDPDLVKDHSHGTRVEMVNSREENSSSHDHIRKSDVSCEGTLPVDNLSTSDSPTPQLALKLAFTLPTSCYATMAIRELLKSSTSVASQKTVTHP